MTVSDRKQQRIVADVCVCALCRAVHYHSYHRVYWTAIYNGPRVLGVCILRAAGQHLCCTV